MSDTNLVFPAAIDLAGLDRDIQTAEGLIAGFAETSAARLANMPTARLQIDTGGGADQIAGSLLPLADKLRTAVGASLGQAAVQLSGFAADFSGKFDNVGATVEKLAIRIDDAMRFPAFLRRLEGFQRGFRRAFGLAFLNVEDDAKKSMGQVAARFEADASKLVGTAKRARDQIKKAVAPIPGDVGYALEGATHVDARKSYGTFLAGLDQVRSSAVDKMKAIADAVAHPGRGSRRGVRARAAAADLSRTQAAVPPRDNTTAPTIVRNTALLDRFKSEVVKFSGVSARAFAQAINPVTFARGLALGTSGMITLYKQTKITQSVLSTFGSVANATFPKLSKLAAPKLAFDPRQSAVLKGIGGAARSAAGGLKSFAAQGALALGVFGFAFKAVGFFKDGAKGASDLNETVSKTDALLGGASAGVKAFADDMATRFGLVKGVTLDTASSMAGLARNLGRLKGDRLGAFSMQFTKLAADLSSFANIDISEAASAIQTGLAGNQSDKLRELGIILTKDTIDAYAFTHGIAKVGEELNETQKFAARSALILRGMSRISGDLEKTQGGAANQARKLTGSISNLGTAIGSAFQPAIIAGIGFLNKGVASAASFFDRGKTAVASFAATVAGGFARVGALVSYLMPEIKAIGATLLGAFSGLGGPVNSLVPTFARVAEAIKGALIGVNNGLRSAIDWVKGIPTAVDSAFGAGTVASIITFAQQFGGISLVAAGIGSAIAAAGGALASVVAVMGSVPALVGLAGASVVALAGNFIDWSSAIETVGFVVRNMSDIWGIAQLSIGQNIAYVIDTLALIPTNLGKIATYIGSNWLDIVTAPFKFLARLIKEVAKSIGDLATGKGFRFDTDAVLKDYKQLQAKLPELAKAKVLNIDDGLKERFDSISRREMARKTPVEPFRAPTTAAELAKAPAAAAMVDEGDEAPGKKKKDKKKDKEEIKFAGALELGSKEAYSSIVAATSGRSKGMDALAQAGKATAGNTAELVKLQAEANRKGRNGAGKGLVIA